MRVFNYHPLTGLLIGESIADKSPLEDGVFIIPAFSTDIEPPSQINGKHCVFVEGQWVLLDVASEVSPIAELPDESIEQTISRFESALDAHLDSVARTHRYRDRITFAVRSGYPGPYQAEGAAFGTWMDTCNAQAYALLGRVESGTETMPTIEAFIASLPDFAPP